jgi:hypothetical protein
MNARPTAVAKDPGAPLGVALLVAWLVLVASGFWWLVAVPMREAAATALDPRQALVVERWATEVAGPAAGVPRVLHDDAACACAEQARTAVLGRLRAHPATTARIPVDAPRLPLRPELVVLDADGRLRYAGPAAPTAFCAGPRHAAEIALALPADAPALVLPRDCGCDTG